jgi:tetratricopeptide (TPR) repeat protein
LSLLLVGFGCRTPTLTPEEAIRRGDELAAKKEYAEAIASYRSAVQSNPGDGKTRLKLANAYLSAGQWGNAAPEAIRAADLLPNDTDAQVLAISMMLGQQRFVDALDRAVARLQHDPDNPELLIHFGNAKARLPGFWFALSKLEEALRLGQNYEAVRANLRPPTAASDDAEALAAFRRALQLKPRSIMAQMALANFFWAVGRPEDGEEPLAQAARQYDILANRALALYYVRNGRSSEAEPYLKVAASSGDRDAQLVLADLYVRLKRDQEALQILMPLTAERDPAHEASLRVAAIELRLGNREQARLRIDGILKADPKHPRASVLRARYLYMAGNIDQAIAAGRTAVEADPRSAEARWILARALAVKGESEQAYEQFAEELKLNPASTETPKDLLRLALVLGRHREAVDYGRQAVRHNPQDDATALALVKALLGVGDIAGADQALKPLLAKQPSSPQFLAALGAIQAARGDRQAARATYQRALQSDGESFDAVAGLVDLDLQDSRAPAARQRADQALAAHRDQPAYMLLAARAALAAGDAAGAEAGLHRVRQLEPTNLRATLLLAEALTAMNKGSDAERLLRQWLERQPSSVDAALALGRVLEMTGRRKEARASYEEIVAKNPTAATAAARLAALYVEDGERLDVALSLASSAKAQSPNDPAVSDVLGWIYVKKELPTLAILHLESAVRSAPANPVYRYHLGVAYYQAAQHAKAREELTRALALARDFPGAQEAQRILALLQRR